MNYEANKNEALELSRDWPLAHSRGQKVACPACGATGYRGGLWVLSHAVHKTAPCGRVCSARGVNGHSARCVACAAVRGPVTPVSYSPSMSETPTLRPFDPQEAVFTSLAFWVAERDSITPEEAAKNLGNLFDSEPVVAAAAATQEAAAIEAAKPLAAAEAADAIAGILAELRRVLGL